MRAVFQISTGTLETAGGTIAVKEFKYTDNIRYTALYLLFSYFWTSEFIVAMGQVLVPVDSLQRPLSLRLRMYVFLYVP